MIELPTFSDYMVALLEVDICAKADV